MTSSQTKWRIFTAAVQKEKRQEYFYTLQWIIPHKRRHNKTGKNVRENRRELKTRYKSQLCKTPETDVRVKGKRGKRVATPARMEGRLDASRFYKSCVKPLSGSVFRPFPVLCIPDNFSRPLFFICIGEPTNIYFGDNIICINLKARCLLLAINHTITH